MIKVSILYPNSDDSQFDHDYYRTVHMPLIKEKLGTALIGSIIDKGIAGATPGAPAPFACIGHLTFESIEAFQSAFSENGESISSDIPNYTNIEPVIQISEIV